MSEPLRIPVAAGDGYDVVVGRGVLPAIAGIATDDVAQAAVVSCPAVEDAALAVIEALRERGLSVMRVEVPDGERAKDLDVAERAWQALGQAGFTRSDVVVGVGGGAVTDLAGFVAATWLRGVRVAYAPTTLLGMVDAAIGGKTAINSVAGKNLVGAFHQPALVVADLAALDSLPRADYVAGLAEIVKAGFIADPVILDIIERDTAAVLDRSPDVVADLVARSIRVKVAVVTADPREAGLREVLNYGHTLAHAIEKDAGFGAWRHGDAVAVGLCFAAAVARRRRINPLRAEVADRHRAVLSALGLPTSYDAGAWPRLRAAMRVDKKNRGDRLRFVVLDDLARPVVLDNPGEGLLEAAYTEVSG